MQSACPIFVSLSYNFISVGTQLLCAPLNIILKASFFQTNLFDFFPLCVPFFFWSCVSASERGEESPEYQSLKLFILEMRPCDGDSQDIS